MKILTRTTRNRIWDRKEALDRLIVCLVAGGEVPALEGVEQQVFGELVASRRHLAEALRLVNHEVGEATGHSVRCGCTDLVGTALGCEASCPHASTCLWSEGMKRLLAPPREANGQVSC